MALFKTWREWKEIREGETRRPDHSLERWVQAAQELGDDINAMVGHGSKESEKIDKKVADDKSKAKAKEDEKEKPGETKDEIDDEEKDVWKRLKQIHKDQDNAASLAKLSPKKPAGKQANTSSSRS